MILPLLSMVGELIQQRNDLFSIIARKDNEIQDYRDQGVVASRSLYQNTSSITMHFLIYLNSHCFTSCPNSCNYNHRDLENAWKGL